ncbi:hypothetical protein [Amycolatopsis sp. NPDC054798]
MIDWGLIETRDRGRIRQDAEAATARRVDEDAVAGPLRGAEQFLVPFWPAPPTGFPHREVYPRRLPRCGSSRTLSGPGGRGVRALVPGRALDDGLETDAAPIRLLPS